MKVREQLIKVLETMAALYWKHLERSTTLANHNGPISTAPLAGRF